MKDTGGYDEFVVHAPGINLLVFILVPGLVSEEKMPRISHFYSKLLFWIENVYMIGKMTILHLFLVFVVYFRMIVLIIGAEGPYGMWAVAIWIFYAPFFLMYSLCKDINNFVNILKDTKEAININQV